MPLASSTEATKPKLHPSPTHYAIQLAIPPLSKSMGMLGQENADEGQPRSPATIAPDSSPHASVVKPRKPFSFYMSIAALGLLSLITSWDATSLSIALPTITQKLNGTTLLSFWANVSFTLGVAITQPIYVTVSDVFGRKQPLYASMALFVIGTITFATAQTMSILVVGRLIQGLGAGGLDVLEEIILADITTLKERPLYLGLLAIAIALGTITGPIIGALFSDLVDWRWIGWINLPIVGIVFLLSFLCLNLRPIPMGILAKARRLDWIGILLFAAGAAATSLPLSWAGSLYPWSSWRTIVPLIIGVFLLVSFGFYERRPTEAVMPYRIFSSTTATFALITGLIHGLLLYSLLQYLPLFFQAVFLEPPLQAAVSCLPVAILVVVFSFIAPVVVELTRRYKLILWFGWVITTLSLGLWSRVDQSTPRAEAYVFQALLGVGVGIVFTGTQLPMQASVRNVDDVGLAVGMLVVFRLFGALIGLAICSAAFTAEFQKGAVGLFNASAEPITGLEDASQAIGFIPELAKSDLSEESLRILVNLYLGSFKTVWVVLTVLSGVGLAGSFFIRELTLEKDDVGRQGLAELSRPT
ncbi:major facilitator superfamily domain-containing protein [Xylaria palmicola]|nr:major facilitator superfamily domain-containing protein [Xylaria palmicola]